MSDPKDFLARWSRRKREAAEDAGEAMSPTPSAAEAEGERAAQENRKPSDASSARSIAPDKPAPPYDLTRLPSIDSITAATDIRAFLAPGVPPELTRAALRRAWAADLKIRDFVGLADYDWDFNTPGAIPGFGPLEMTDELRRLVMQMVGRSLEPQAPDRPAPTAVPGQDAPTSIETSTELVASNSGRPTEDVQGHVGPAQEEPVKNDDESRNRDGPPRPEKEYIAAQHEPGKVEDQQLIVRRSHGRALPE